VSVEFVFEALEKLLSTGHEMRRLDELLIVAVLGFAVNLVGLLAFHGHSHGHDHGHGGHDHSHDNENMYGIFLHILADAMGSVAVIISTILTKYYGWSGYDPIASLLIAILIFISALPLVKSSGMRLLLSLPANIEYQMRNTLQELSSLRGVVGYAVPKFWLEDASTAHVHAHAHSHKNEHATHTHVHAHDDACEASHGHKHSHHRHEDHNHNHDHDHTHLSAPDHHTHGHMQNHSHDHHDHSNSHSHDHMHAHQQPKVLGVIHIIASRMADLEDVRARCVEFFQSRNMDIVVHVEREGEGRCWCGGGQQRS
jgi:solute carrier family 30 (zinc transporter), member 5/7